MIRISKFNHLSRSILVICFLCKKKAVVEITGDRRRSNSDISMNAILHDFVCVPNDKQRLIYVAMVIFFSELEEWVADVVFARKRCPLGFANSVDFIVPDRHSIAAAYNLVKSSVFESIATSA